MHQDPSYHSRPSLDLTSILVGLGSGIMATLIFAAFRKREFDQLIGRSREMANCAEHFVEHVGDEAQEIRSNVTRAAHDGVRNASRASKDAIESVRHAL